MASELPDKGKKKDKGQVIFNAVERAFSEDAAMPRAFGQAVDAYLRGERNFRIVDPIDLRRTLVEVELEDGFPAHEAVVSEVNAEIGKQQRMDVSPITKPVLETLQAARDSAVGMGILSYHFSERVISRPNRIFQRERVVHGCAGLAVTSTTFPGFGWGLKIINIPYHQLVFLPIHTSTDQVDFIGWRRWLPFSQVKDRFNELSREVGKKIGTLPARGTPEYSDLMVRDVPYGSSMDSRGNLIHGSDSLFAQMGRAPSDGKSSSKGEDIDSSRFVLFTELFGSSDMQHLDRKIILAGKVLMYDETYSEGDRPQMPISVATYADVGGPYGRSFAHARMAVNIRNEKVLTTLLSNFCNTDAYGLIAISANMGIDLGDMFKQGQGFKAISYTTDATHPPSQPLQIAPIQMDKVVGRVFGIMTAVSDAVFPESPLNQGRAPGRVDSDRALERLDLLGQTSLRAGAESARAAWVQVYRAGLELARDHHEEGDSIPIFRMIPELAGVILDLEEVPKSKQTELRANLSGRLRGEMVARGGGDPLLDSQLSDDSGAGVLSFPGSRVPDYVPVARITVGPNIIPSPNTLTIDIRSMLPRDPSAEFESIINAVRLGASSMMEAQIELLVRGLDNFIGGKMVRATYRTAVLNLLSSFGNGVEAGPIVIQPHLFSRQVGYWVISSFVAEPLFGLASETVKNQVLKLLLQYAPVNTTGEQLTADEAAAIFQMNEKQRVLQQQNPQGNLPQLPPGV